MLLRDISQLLITDFRESAPAMITFTYVKLTDDLKYATFYYSCLGDENDRTRVSEFLQSHTKQIRYTLGKNIKLRFIPEFRFKFDPSVEEGIKIEKLLNEIKSDTE